MDSCNPNPTTQLVSHFGSSAVFKDRLIVLEDDDEIMSESWNEEFFKFEPGQSLPPKNQFSNSRSTWKSEFRPFRMNLEPVPLNFNQVLENNNSGWQLQFERAQEALTKVSLKKNDEVLFAQFNDIWNNIELGKLEERFDELGGLEDYQPISHESIPIIEYEFEQENPFLLETDPIALGLALVQSNSLSEACLAFEAAAQKDLNNSEAWCLLGLCQAQNEKEDAAISALQQSYKLEPNDLTCLMSLAVSYTNEGYDFEVNKLMKAWLVRKYPQITWPENGMIHPSKERHVLIQNFIKAVRLNSGIIDADVQIALGILFYNDAEYEKSIDCFSTALKVRPDDFILWNRLGATLANSGRSEEAIGKYKQALNIRPNFVRALNNLGVSCMNIGCYKEAAEYILSALSWQQIDKSKVSSNLWDTLRRNFVYMERNDLVTLADSKDINLFRNEFNF